MHGAGNDFVLIDDRTGAFPSDCRAAVARLSHRRTGIGCDGVILIQRSDRADLRVRFFNSDGGEAEMCGNALRCAARLAHELGAAGAAMSIETAAGELGAEVLDGGTVRLRMTPPTDWRPDGCLELKGATIRYGFVNTGVPHAIVEADDLPSAEGDPFPRVAALIRRHAVFAPAGANVNAVRVDGPHRLTIRTFERGVEAETLACGTGATASALVMARRGRVQAPVAVGVAGGDVLTVDFRLTDAGAEHVTLSGPAVHVFRGETEI